MIGNGMGRAARFVRAGSAGVGLLLLAASGEAGAQDKLSCTRERNALRETKTTHVSADSLAGIKRRYNQCVDMVDNQLKMMADRAVRSSMAELADVFLSIPEYHDEGRLPTGTTSLGPMAFIYASPMMGSFSRKAQIFEHQEPGVPAPGPLAAIVVVQRDQGDVSPIPATYANLLLDYGVNCLWLKAASAAANADYAVYVSRPTTPAGQTPVCRAADPLVTDAAGVPAFLEVSETRDARFRDNDSYPGAARFDVDRVGKPTLGFKCLRAYCEAMLDKDDWRRSQITPQPASPGDPKQKTIKAWHDEQMLSTVSSTGVWSSIGIRASIIPDASIADNDATDFNDQWLPVAEIFLDTDPAAGTKYANWGLHRGSNYLHMKFDVAAAEWRVGLFATSQARPGNRIPATKWSHRGRMIHRNAGVPATARFRFTERDDGVWVPCGNACCKVDGET